MNTARLSSWLLLGGIVSGFFGATWEGHRASTYSKPAGFKRFHQRLSPDASFYPPYAMLESLALARWHPGQTLVILGGNSIMNGVGQPADVVWSDRLQELLGDSYVVVNLAFRSAFPAQGAALVAESLLRRGLPVIYVANTYPLSGSGQAAGGPYGYLYWQARSQDKLADFPARDGQINRWLAALPASARAHQAEERLGARLDAWLRPQSLWHHVGYRHFFTVWNSILARDFWVPRARCPDNEPPAAPLEQRFTGSLPEELAVVRSYTEGFVEPGPAGPWRLVEPIRQQLIADLEAAFLPALRPHVLILLDESAAYYLARLTPLERERNHFAYHATAQFWREHGIACEVTGEDFAPIDYIDRMHLSSDGGRKLAQLVARRITQLNSPLP